MVVADPAALVGRSYASERAYTVGREKIREFADAIGDPSPVYRDVEAARAYGHDDVIAPPTFPIVVGFGPLQAMLDDLGAPLSRIMHADQKFQAYRPIRPGDRLTATLTVDTVRRVAGTDLIATTTRITDETGAEVCTASAKIVHRSGSDERERGAVRDTGHRSDGDERERGAVRDTGHRSEEPS